MKSYSFIRENAYKVLYPWNKDDDHGAAVWYEGQMSPKVASFSQYLYFIIAPTMLYRDHYPRYAGKENSELLYSTNLSLSLSFSMFLLCSLLFACTCMHFRNKGRIRWRYVLVYFIQVCRNQMFHLFQFIHIILQFLTTIWYMSVVHRDFTSPKAFR